MRFNSSEFFIRFQPPSVMHMVYTPIPSIFTGGYFFTYETMHLTRLALHLHKKRADFTNDRRAGTIRTLSRMMMALRYRSKPSKFLPDWYKIYNDVYYNVIIGVFSKRSLLSFILIFMKGENGNGTDYVPSPKTCAQLMREENGDLMYAKQCSKELLDWLGMDVKTAEEYVIDHTNYMTSGTETVEIPTRVPWSDDDGMGLPSVSRGPQSGQRKH